jgi:hypothetical protein
MLTKEAREVPMSRGSMQLLAALLFAIPLAAADGSVCENCFDGPEMFEYGRHEGVVPEIEAIELRCDKGRIQKKLGHEEWLISQCDDGTLAIAAAPGNPVTSGFFLFEKAAGEYQLFGVTPTDRRGRAAYRDLQALTGEQIGQLVRELREVRESD